MKQRSKAGKKAKLPEMFRPLLWSYKFEEIDPDLHKEEIIVNTINLGSMKHWRWLVKQYGRDVIGRVLKGRLESEFNNESLNLARLIFGIGKMRHVRGSAN